jgi:hypothetical protein
MYVHKYMYVRAPALEAAAPAMLMVWLQACIYLSVIIYTQWEL